MITLNLLPDVKKEFLHAQRMRARTIAGSILIAIVAFGLTAALGVYVFVAQPIYSLTISRDIENKTNELNEIEDLQKYVNLQNQLASIDALHEGKGDFSRLLDYLPQLNPSDKPVSLSQVNVLSEGATITLQGSVADYPGLNTFKDTLSNADLVYGQDGEEIRERLFPVVTVTSASVQRGSDVRVTFEISLTYNPIAFDKSTENPTVQVPRRNTTQSVIDSPNVFDGEENE